MENTVNLVVLWADCPVTLIIFESEVANLNNISSGVKWLGIIGRFTI